MAEEALDVCYEQAALCPLCLASPGRAAAGPLPSTSSFLLPFDDPELPPIHLPGLGRWGKGCALRGSIRVKLQEEGRDSTEPITWKGAQDIHCNR